MVKLTFNKQFFCVKDTLECGQLFRFAPFKDGYLVFSLDKCCYAYNDNEKAYIICEENDKDYFTHYFDCDRDYEGIYNSAVGENIPILSTSANLGKGVRILNQNKAEALFSFIVSQNNNIPRIKGIIERLCNAIGEEKTFDGVVYHAFPTIEKMASQSVDFYKSVGLGYRADYFYSLANRIKDGFDVNSLDVLPTKELKKELLSIYGVGPKVADCVSLFGFHRSDAFPVDTWIEKVYREDFNGELTDRTKIADFFTDRFKDNSGYYQQYLFYYKRSLQKTEDNK